MKPTDYAPRTGALESYLPGNDLIGIEIGVDVGAHAESLLTYCSIKKLYLVDIWTNPYCEGYCMGRLGKWINRFMPMHCGSEDAVKKFADNYFDFVYLDQKHEYGVVINDLNMWYEKLKPGGIIALRNYGAGNPDLKRAADEFVKSKKFKIEEYNNEILIWK